MQVIKNIAPFFLQRARDHDEVKDKILAIIDGDRIFGSLTPNESISNTDFYLADMFRQNKCEQYWAVILPSIQNHYEEILNVTGLTAWSVHKYWFQTYKPNDYHKWHVHAGCMFSNVYYLSLPDGAAKTSFSYLGEEFQIEVQEGDILTFPSFLPHCSKENKSTLPKHVISFNSNLNM
jgi:hypothetical protein